MSNQLKSCAAHLAEYDVISQDLTQYRVLTADGDFWMRTTINGKIRCRNCGVIELTEYELPFLAPIDTITWRGLWALLRRKLLSTADRHHVPLHRRGQGWVSP